MTIGVCLVVAGITLALALAAIDMARQGLSAFLYAAIAFCSIIFGFYIKYLTDSTVQDIIQRKQAELERLRAEEALRESEERFRQITEHCNEVFFVISSDLSSMIYVNPAYETLWQLSCQSLYEHPLSFMDIIHDEDRPRVITALEQLRHGEIFDQTYCIVRSERKECWIHARIYPVHAEYGKLYRYLGVAEDVTKQKLAEEQIRKMQQAVEQSPVSIVITDCAGKIEYVNPKVTQLTGFSFIEAVGQRPCMFKSGETSADIYRQLWENLTAGGEWHGEILNKKKNGELFWESLTISPMKNPAGQITHYLGVKEDISARKRMEEELIDARDAAEESNRLKSAFLANMSHEIRTPMNGIIGMTELLNMTDLTEEQKSYVGALSQSCDKLLVLINDIIDLSKIEADMIKIELADFSLHHCLNDVVLTQKSVIHEKGLSLDMNVAKDVPLVLVGDPLRVKQIIFNLLVNAVKFTAQGGITISAQVLDHSDRCVCVQIAVCDTGIGIPADALDKIFEPFVQEDSSITRKFGGTGLGLAISRRLAELVEGSICVESEPGVGSRFIVTLPFFHARNDIMEDDTKEETAVTWDGAPLRILFVEDNPINITCGATMLRKLGHDVVSAVNGKDCLVALKTGAFDLVLMDIQMPVLNGMEALQGIRRKEQGTSIHQPVIALTAYSLRSDKECFLREGFDGYLSKPFRANELIYEMKRVIELFEPLQNEVGYRE